MMAVSMIIMKNNNDNGDNYNNGNTNDENSTCLNESILITITFFVMAL